MKKNIYVLNPDYIIQNDVTRYFLYNNLHLNNGSSLVKTFLHPIQALVFSYFTFEPRTLQENVSFISKAIGYNEDDVLKMIEPFLENQKPKLLKYKDTKIVIPKNFLIKFDKLRNKYLPLKLNVSINMDIETVDIKTKRLNVAPYMITFMLTNRCCTKCCYCYADTSTQITNLIPTKRIIEIIHKAKRLGIYNINVIGGEVFLHKDWHIILKSIVDEGFSPPIISTKIPITEEIAEKIHYTGFHENLQLSLDSLNAEVLCKTLKVGIDYITNIKKGIKILEEKKIPYQIETVLTKLTATKDNIEEMFHFFSKMKYVTRWEIRTASYSIYKNEHNFNILKSDKKSLNNLFDFIDAKIKTIAPIEILASSEDINKKYYTSRDGCCSFKGNKCSALNNHIFILPDGKVTICEQLYWNPDFIIGDINSASIEEIWNSPRALALANLEREDIHDSSACKSCHFFDMCFHIDRNRCWANIIKAYGKNNWDYPDPRCAYAPIMKNKITY